MFGLSLIAEHRIVVGNVSKTLAELIGPGIADKVSVMETIPAAVGIFEAMDHAASASDVPVELGRGRFQITDPNVARLNYYAASDIAMTVRFFGFVGSFWAAEGAKGASPNEPSGLGSGELLRQAFDLLRQAHNLLENKSQQNEPTNKP